MTKLLTNDPSLGGFLRGMLILGAICGDALAQSPADALIVSVHSPDVANWRQRRLTEEALERFDFPSPRSSSTAMAASSCQRRLGRAA